MNYRDEKPMFYSAHDAVAPVDEGLRAYLLNVYNLMASALALTGITSYAGAHWEPLMSVLYTVHNGHLGPSGLGWLVFIAPIGIVLGLGAGINRLSLGAAQALFWTFAAVNGLSLSTIFFAYTGESIVRVFFITAIVFGSMSMWGYSTKRDLSGMGHFFYMGVWGIFVAMIVNLFLHSSGLQFAISVVGVLAFTALTAYDTQRIKSLYYQLAGSGDMAAKFAIMGALRLYLDFINMFVMLVQLFGDRRN